MSMPTSALYRRLKIQVDSRPQALALRQGQKSWCYAELNSQIDATLRRLTRQGLARGDKLGWLGHNVPEMLATLFACARAGIVLVPLNGRLAAPELAVVAAHAGLAYLIATPDLEPLATRVRALAGADAWQQRHAPVAAADAGGDVDDMLLVYTSGTTGAPKGAIHTQAAMSANADAAIAAQDLDASTRALAVLPLFHVGGLCIQTLPTLLAGGAVDLHPRFDAAAWLREVAAWRPSTSLIVPAVMRALVDHADWPTSDLSSLRFVTTGSQVVPVALIERFHARGIPVAQVYGSTETGPMTLALRPDEAMAQVGRSGRAALGVTVRLVDAAGADAAEGQVGEICCRAAQTMRGYHRQADHPAFSEGWFHSGDLARRDADGVYQVVGRASDLIISGGENIYPAEIENLAALHPGVAEAAVVGVADPRWGEVPVLVLVAHSGTTPDLIALQALFDERLARFKHPREVVLRSSLPRTELGKVKRSELAAEMALRLRQRRPASTKLPVPPPASA
jgi:fatty-acyl-CoA synthase